MGSSERFKDQKSSMDLPKRMHNFRQTIARPIVCPETKSSLKLFLFGVHNAAWFGCPFGVMHSSVRVQKGCSASASFRGWDCEDLPLEIFCWTRSTLCRNEVEFPECCRSSPEFAGRSSLQ